MKTILITISLFFVLTASGQKRELYEYKYQNIPSVIVLTSTVLTVEMMGFTCTPEQRAMTALTGVLLSIATYHLTRYIHRRNFYRKY